MLDSIVLEQRLEAVEQALAELQHQIAGKSQKPHWLDAVTGSITDEAAFREVIELGRAFRDADRPTDLDEGDR